MVMPDTLETAGDVYDVSGANGSFLPFLFGQHVHFGPYSARVGVGIESESDSGPTLFNAGKETRTSSQSGWFTLQSSASHWRGRCVREERVEIDHHTSIELNSHGIHDRDETVITAQSHKLRCHFQNAGEAVWQLVLDLDWNGPDAGRVTSTQGELRFGPTFEQRYQPFAWAHELAGYVIQDATGPVAALDMGGRPRVAFGRTLAPNQRELVAVICIAVLLQRFLG
jgi:hypothetical protein